MKTNQQTKRKQTFGVIPGRNGSISLYFALSQFVFASAVTPC